ncbi:thiolase family protein [Anaerovibrio sp.]|uniref:thiolase family protein n=1 Tax=Anaerovibrio sp. TaxID=1872532 RepID=UPI0025E1F42B|nr:thiolase family protein [Anaerovibrio sp.]
MINWYGGFMNKVYVLGGMRTPIVTKNSCFRTVTAEELGAAVVKQLCRCYVHNCKLDGIIAGNAVGTGGNMARLMTLKAGLDKGVPAMTVDMQCASGAAAIATGFSYIASGIGDIYICGGMESSSLQPVRIYSEKDRRYAMTADGDGKYMTAQFSPDDLSEDVMLRGADRIIKKEGVTRAELDYWVMRSHRLAAECAEKGILADVIVPVNGFNKDNGIRKRMSQQLLDRLPPVLEVDSLLNAGNACLINDGAAFVVLVSDKWLAENTTVIPQAEIVSVQSTGTEPRESPRGAMNTADCLLEKEGLVYDDMDAIEFNEAFAVIDVLFQRKKPALTGRYNLLGGALAYGHPYGASGGILMIHLLKALELNHGSMGIMSIAGAGGMGQAMLLKRIKK